MNHITLAPVESKLIFPSIVQKYIDICDHIEEHDKVVEEKCTISYAVQYTKTGSANLRSDTNIRYSCNW